MFIYILYPYLYLYLYSYNINRVYQIDLSKFIVRTFIVLHLGPLKCTEHKLTVNTTQAGSAAPQLHLETGIELHMEQWEFGSAGDWQGTLTDIDRH